MVNRLALLACVACGFAVAIHVGCGSSDSNGSAGTSNGQAPDSSTLDGGSPEDGSRGGDGGSPADGGEDASRVVYPPGSGSVVPTDGGFACTPGNWSIGDFNAVGVTTGTPLSMASFGDELSVLFVGAAQSGVQYAHRDGAGSWSIEAGPLLSVVVDPGSLTASMVLDATGVPHAVFGSWTDPFLKLAVRTAASTWQTSDVRSSTSYEPSLALEPSGAPHIAVSDGHNISEMRMVDGGWTDETAAAAQGSSSDVGQAIALPPTGSFVCYSGSVNQLPTGQGVGCVQRADGGVWSTVAAVGDAVHGYAGRPALFMSPQGDLTLGLIATSARPNSITRDLQYVTFTRGSAWFQIATQDTFDSLTGPTAMMSAPKILRDSAGHVHIGYAEREGSSVALKHIDLRPDGSATGVVVACEGFVFDMAITPSGGPVFVYSTDDARHVMKLAHP